MNLTVQIISASEIIDLKAETEIKVIGFYKDDVEALKVTEKQKPTIILLDYEIEKSNTGLYIKSLLIESPESKVILLGENLDEEIILSCLVSGSYGYLEWINVEKFLIKAIGAVGSGEAWVSRKLVGLLLERFRD